MAVLQKTIELMKSILNPLLSKLDDVGLLKGFIVGFIVNESFLNFIFYFVLGLVLAIVIFSFYYLFKYKSQKNKLITSKLEKDMEISNEKYSIFITGEVLPNFTKSTILKLMKNDNLSLDDAKKMLTELDKPYATGLSLVKATQVSDKISYYGLVCKVTKDPKDNIYDMKTIASYATSTVDKISNKITGHSKVSYITNFETSLSNYKFLDLSCAFVSCVCLFLFIFNFTDGIYLLDLLALYVFFRLVIANSCETKYNLPLHKYVLVFFMPSSFFQCTNGKSLSYPKIKLLILSLISCFFVFRGASLSFIANFVFPNRIILTYLEDARNLSFKVFLSIKGMSALTYSLQDIKIKGIVPFKALKPIYEILNQCSDIVFASLASLQIQAMIFDISYVISFNLILPLILFLSAITKFFNLHLAVKKLFACGIIIAATFSMAIPISCYVGMSFQKNITNRYVSTVSEFEIDSTEDKLIPFKGATKGSIGDRLASIAAGVYDSADFMINFEERYPPIKKKIQQWENEITKSTFIFLVQNIILPLLAIFFCIYICTIILRSISYGETNEIKRLSLEDGPSSKTISG